MSYRDEVGKLAGDPQQLEQTYHSALASGERDAFEEAINSSYQAAPDNLLYAAWFHRLKYTAAKTKEFVIAWAWLVPLAFINGLLFWFLSDDRYMVTIKEFRGNSRDFMPAFFLLAAPIAGVALLIYLSAAGQKRWRHVLTIGSALLAATAYVWLVYPQMGVIPFQEQYLTLMVPHLALLAWAAVGTFLIARHRDPANRFSFLIKSLEVFIVGGLFFAALGVFTAITIGLFDALDVDFPESMQRLFIAGGLGLIVVAATAITFNPALPPADQSFDEGLSKLLALLMRVLLPFTLLVLLVYILFIPFNFSAPFDNRDVLIIYNAMLFAVVLLLVGATPIALSELSPRVARWLRRGIIAVAVLAIIVSLYALAAILYRTALDRLTPNRLTIIGWNVINIGLLILILVYQLRAKGAQWLQKLYRAFSSGTAAYVLWALVVILVLPWLFGRSQETLDGLPVSVQRIIYEHPDPILLKCYTSPHIYLIEEGEKRWINNIETFNDRGYEWNDVHFILCGELRSIPDGAPIPPDAGPPPQP